MFLSNLRVAYRLSMGFGISLLLLIAIAWSGRVSMTSTIEDTADLLNHQLKNERLAGDWRTVVEANLQRSLAAIMTNDPDVQKFFEDGIAKASRQGEEDQRLLAENLHDPRARALYAAALAKRAEILGIRKMALEAKAAGDVEQSKLIVDREYVPASAAYLATVKLLIERQKDVIDEVGHGIEVRSKNANRTGMLLTLASVAFAMAAGWLITRSLLRQLGGEPGYAAEITDRVSAGDLTVKVRLRPGDQGSLLHSIAAMRDRLAAMVLDVRHSTNSVTKGTDEIAVGNMDLSSRTEQQAGALQETASSMHQLTDTVKQNGDYARQANQLAAAASDVAIRGGGVVTEAVSMMNSIDASSRKIVDIIGVIDSIAFQTNILALNAAVEAARAGEQGRGFAVVATEVRNLAHRSASAAKDIKALICDSVEKIANGSRLVHEAGATMAEIVASVRQVREIMDDINTASREQEAGIMQINQALGEMDGVTQQNAALVEQAAAAAGALQDQAGTLCKAVSVFKLDGLGDVVRNQIAPASSPRRGAVASIER